MDSFKQHNDIVYRQKTTEAILAALKRLGFDNFPDLIQQHAKIDSQNATENAMQDLVFALAQRFTADHYTEYQEYLNLDNPKFKELMKNLFGI